MSKNWAICIGINNYGNLPSLRYAVRDAQAMRDFLLREADFEQVFHFSDDAPPIETPKGPMNAVPTFGNLKRFFRVRFEREFLRAGDNLWLFFAGHGVQHNGYDYLMPKDVDPGDVEGTALKVSDITARLQRSGADNTVLLLDACRNQGRRAAAAFGEDEQKGVVTIYSCRPQQFSYEIEALQQGAFTHALLEGFRLRGAESCATVERINQYLRHQVPALNARYRQPAQTPYVSVEPLSKRCLILLPRRARLEDVEAIKNVAFRAENAADWDFAQRIWTRVLAASQVDQDAISAFGRIALKRQQQSVDKSGSSTEVAASRAIHPPKLPKQTSQPIQPQQVERRNLQTAADVRADPAMFVCEDGTSGIDLLKLDIDRSEDVELASEDVVTDVATLGAQVAETEAEDFDIEEKVTSTVDAAFLAGLTLENIMMDAAISDAQVGESKVATQSTQSVRTRKNNTVRALGHGLQVKRSTPLISQNPFLSAFEGRISRRQAMKALGFSGGGLGAVLLGRALFQSVPEVDTNFADADVLTATAFAPVQFKTVTVNDEGKTVEEKTTESSVYRENLEGLDLDLMPIAGGTFVMGSPAEEVGREEDEGPQREVTVTPFLMGRYQVTQQQWRAVAAWDKVEQDLEASPSAFEGDDRPVERVSWNDAVEFCKRLSAHAGREYRLPTEAEWEYACRAGTITPFHFGDTLTADIANYDANYTYGDGPKGTYRNQTIEVGSFPANAFGLYDMHGNVWEWCADHWHENYEGAPTDGSAWITGGDSDRRLLRGGSWHINPDNCRSANRHWVMRVSRYNDVGFRIVCASAWTLA